MFFENKNFAPATLVNSDIPPECEIIDFSNVHNLEIKSKLLCCFIKNIFPPSVKQMLNFNFENTIEETLLPTNLKYISFSSFFDKKFTRDFFPLSVRTIELCGVKPYLINKDILPINLECLIIDKNCVIESLPENLIKFKISKFKNTDTIINNLPTSLKILEIDYLTYELLNLPTSLEKLIIHGCSKKIRNKIKIPFECVADIVYDLY